MCATVARQVFWDAVLEVGLEPHLVDDRVLMASDLAASTLHAHAAAGTGGGGDRLLYLPSTGIGAELMSAGPAPSTPSVSFASRHPAVLVPEGNSRRLPL
jgi:hypothetical protein